MGGKEKRIVVVMGATGSGKSKLIRLATGDSSVAVGHDLKSETNVVTSHIFEFAGLEFALVDTPGFDDTFICDRDILESVSTWLTNSYRQGTRVSAILYVYRISDPRMQGSALRNFRVFRDLCGEDAFSRVTLCTTFWDLYDSEPSIPIARYEELRKDQFWGGMLERGSQMCKAPTTQEEARKFFYDMTREKPTVLKIQREIIDEGKSLDETTAMLGFLDLELKRQKEEYEKEMQTVKQKWDEEIAERDRRQTEELEKMRKEFEEKLKAQQDDSNSKLESEMKRRMSEQAEQMARLQKQTEQLKLRRAQTELDTHFQDAVRLRQNIFHQFTNNVIASIRVLETGKKSGKLKCDMAPIKRSYTMVCNNCLRTIGRRNFYECLPCTRKGDFTLCATCYSDSAVHCNDAKHNKDSMVQRSPVDLPSSCPRVNVPPQDRQLTCVKCRKNVGICYLHCCACEEEWDLCVNCALKGKHCPGHRRAFPRTPHKPEICFRYLGRA